MDKKTYQTQHTTDSLLKENIKLKRRLENLLKENNILIKQMESLKYEVDGHRFWHGTNNPG